MKRFLKFALGLLIALLIFWGFYGFVKDENWLAVSALATLILALAAFWAIWQNYNFRKSEKRERLLNEIIEWATDIRKSSLGSIAPNEIIYDDASMATASQMDFLRLRRTYQDINTNGTYVKAIAKVCSGNLLSVTESVVCKLDEIIKILKDCLTTRKEGKHERVEACKTLLDSSAQDLIDEATKIKTENIGKKEENMAKGSEATGSNELTLKDIKEHLKQQDKRAEKGKYLAMSSAGVAVALVGLSLLGQGLSHLGQRIDGWSLILLGFGFIFWCMWKQSKVK